MTSPPFIKEDVNFANLAITPKEPNDDPDKPKPSG